ncbi:AAA family ATPase [Rhodovulum sp. 12E13]|uniref:AAA family ATPase n=1 Tax=Rhodovulum sp. 12E13 TaxID=2203891 RepID=UPI00131405AC|nr:AAA family ATPase [Rhodovulum sp. 12E13]
MAFEVAFQNFRGFHHQKFSSVRPITILVGENSAGKTSFLAGVKYLLDFVSTNKEPDFNADPFQLGTFDQISHFRGGRGGRARSFSLVLRQTLVLRKSRRSETSGRFEVTLTLSFSSADSNAALSSVKIESNGKAIEATSTPEGLRISFVSKRNERFLLDEPSSLPPVTRFELARYWPFLIRDIRYRIGRRETAQADFVRDDIERSISELSDLADAITMRSTPVGDATSAIRTKPHRTYTPGTESEDGEGSHVPYEIARLYRSRNRNEEDWNELKTAIEKFGQQSEMFREFHVKSFGQTASDPFQLQFSNDGPRMNLMDLGYGTSQVLPILYGVERLKRRNYYLVQQPEVHLHPKAQAALGQYFVEAHAKRGINFIIETHSDYILDRIRMAVARNEIDSEDISLLFFRRNRLDNAIEEIGIDENGDPVSPPEEYRSFFRDEQLRSLGL